MKHLLRRTALGGVVLAAAGLGFAAATPLRVIAPDLAALAASRNVTLAADARLARGQADVALMTPDVTVTWRLAGGAVAPPGLRFAVQVTGALTGNGAVVAEPFTRRIDLARVTLRGSMAQLIDRPVIGAFGDIVVTLDHASLAADDATIHAALGTLVWQDAALRIEDRIALGRVEGQISVPASGIVVIGLSNSGGDLDLRGTLRLDQAAGVVEADLFTRAGADTPASVRAMLDARGVAEADGTRITERISIR